MESTYTRIAHAAPTPDAAVPAVQLGAVYADKRGSSGSRATPVLDPPSKARPVLPLHEEEPPLPRRLLLLLLLPPIEQSDELTSAAVAAWS